MNEKVVIVGAGLAGSEAAYQLASRGFDVVLYEMRPTVSTAVHKTAYCAELVCSNSLKSMKADSAAGMLKAELAELGSLVYSCACENAVDAGGALAVDRNLFARTVTRALEENPRINMRREEVTDIAAVAQEAAAVVVASGPLTSDGLALSLQSLIGGDYLAFFDAEAPIVMADSIDMSKVFRQSRYEDALSADGVEQGDYLNAPFTKEEYERFAGELVAAQRAITRDFETRELFQACQPIEEIARKGIDAPRFGALKPVGLVDPNTGKRPWAAVQLRAEDRDKTSYNLVGFQTNLKHGEQKRVFRMIPGLENAEFARFGVMHRNTFIDAPRLLNADLELANAESTIGVPVYIAGQLGGTEGYCEAIRSGLHVAISVAARLKGVRSPALPPQTAFGALLSHATDPSTADYQPMHVNFGIMPPLESHVRNKNARYAAYAERGREALATYKEQLEETGLLSGEGGYATGSLHCDRLGHASAYEEVCVHE